MSYHIAQYTNIIADLRKEIFRLKLKISEHDTDSDGNSSKFWQYPWRVIITRGCLRQTCWFRGIKDRFQNYSHIFIENTLVNINQAVGCAVKLQYLMFAHDLSPAKEKHKDKNPEEMNRLRDQLVGTFKEQMDIRWVGARNGKVGGESRATTLPCYSNTDLTCVAGAWNEKGGGESRALHVPPGRFSCSLSVSSCLHAD